MLLRFYTRPPVCWFAGTLDGTLFSDSAKVKAVFVCLLIIPCDIHCRLVSLFFLIVRIVLILLFIVNRSFN